MNVRSDRVEADGIILRPVYGIVENHGKQSLSISFDRWNNKFNSLLGRLNNNSQYKIIYATIPPVPTNRTYVDYPDGWTECAIPRKCSPLYH